MFRSIKDSSNQKAQFHTNIILGFAEIDGVKRGNLMNYATLSIDNRNVVIWDTPGSNLYVIPLDRIIDVGLRDSLSTKKHIGIFGTTRETVASADILIKYLSNSGVDRTVLIRIVPTYPQKFSPQKRASEVVGAIQRFRKPLQAPKSRDEKECPYCAEIIKAKAIVCKHCGSSLK